MRTRWTRAGGERGLLRRLTTAGTALALGLGLLLPSAASAATPFPDVPADSPHLAAIDDLVTRGAVVGKADGTFGPADLLTRGQLASILARSLELAPRSSGPFPDVSGPHAGAINALAGREIILGRADGTFGVNGTITRDQVASMIARLLELDDVAADAFDDVPSGNVHRGAINALAEVGVALGDGAGNYGPRRDLRRDQAASFVARALALLDDGTPGPGPGPGPDPGPIAPHTVTRTSSIAGQPLDLQLGAYVVDDLDPDGQTVRVVGRGFPGDGVATAGGADCAGTGSDPRCAGIYVTVCALGASHAAAPPYPTTGAAPSPCLGGVDLEGETGASAWISDDPPSYGATLVEPYGAGGSFDLELNLTASDEFTDCREAEHGCAIITRRDHVAGADRSLDLYLPITFATDPAPEVVVTPGAGSVAAGQAQTFAASGFAAGEQVDAILSTEGEVVRAAARDEVIGTGTADADGAVTIEAIVPEATPPGEATVTLMGATSGRSAATTFAVQRSFSSPSITLSSTEDLIVGDTVTVSGAGFDPAANISTRVPVTAGQPSGVYVVLGKFAETWRPSAGAPSSARGVISQKWAMPAASRDQVANDFPSQAAALAVIEPDGTFEVELTVGTRDGAGTYGVYTYAGGGAVANPVQELAVPVTLAPITFGAGPADWGVKASFRNYITGPIASGSITMTEPATRNTDGTFRFAPDAVVLDPGTGDLEVTFAGGVSFRGHAYGDADPLLEMHVSAVRVVIAGSEGRLHADVRSKSLASGEMVDYPDVHLADLDVSSVTPTTVDGVTTWTAIPATLTEAGVPAFAEFYPADTELDPFTFRYTAPTG